jgi:hypothetical protein
MSSILPRPINIIDSSFAHCGFSNNTLPGLRYSNEVQWIRNNILSENDYVIYTDNHVPYSRKNKQRDISWLIEPRELIPGLYDHVARNSSSFFKIFTHDKDLLKLNNAHFIPFGGCWIKNENLRVNTKSKNVSIVVSGKKFLTGHKLRHEIVKRYGDRIDVFGGGYKPIEDKSESLTDYRFQIVVENTKKDYWFTEKLIDCFVTGTVPIYWGCPSIHKFFNIGGIINFDNINELDPILDMLDENLYNNSAYRENFQTAFKYILAEQHIAKFFDSQVI